MSDRPKLIGVTGGIGSGKSTVCKILEVLGHKVYYSDDRGKWLMQNDPRLIHSISQLFGEKAYEGANLNRKWIGERVFKSPELLAKLNTIVHPAVADDLKMWVEQNGKEKILFNEAALLFETGSYQKMNATILVVAPEEIRIQRVLARDHYRTKESIRDIIMKQMRDEEKIPLADFVIENDGKQSTIRQTMSIYREWV